MSRPANTSELLRAHNIRPSLQRIAVMDYLLTHRTHPTADEIYGALAPHIPTLSKTTVYNTLRLFVEKGAAQMLTIDGRQACFDGDVRPHAHFFCKRCGRIFDLPLPEDMGAGRFPPGPERCCVEEVQLYYRGVCADCLGREA